MRDVLDVEVALSNFEGRATVSLREFIGYASMDLEETAFHEGEQYSTEKIKRLHDALIAHGKHEPDCWQWLKDSCDPSTRCTCAIGEALSSDNGDKS